MNGDVVPVPLEGARAAGAEAGGGGASDAVPVPLEGPGAAGADRGGGGTDESGPEGSSSDGRSES